MATTNDLKNGLVLITDKDAENAWTSRDAGGTWEGPFPSGAKP